MRPNQSKAKERELSKDAEDLLRQLVMSLEDIKHGRFKMIGCPKDCDKIKKAISQRTEDIYEWIETTNMALYYKIDFKKKFGVKKK